MSSASKDGTISVKNGEERKQSTFAKGKSTFAKKAEEDKAGQDSHFDLDNPSPKG